MVSFQVFHSSGNVPYDAQIKEEKSKRTKQKCKHDKKFVRKSMQACSPNYFFIKYIYLHFNLSAIVLHTDTEYLKKAISN